MTLPAHLSAHHESSVARVIEHFSQQPNVHALLLTGSLAHGFARPTSDVDIAIVVSDDDYQNRKRTSKLTFFDNNLCTYPGGYVDGKYVSVQFIRDVAVTGSEPARFAFKDATVLFSHIDGLDQIVAAASRYPAERKAENLARFMAQFEAWNWYVEQALQVQDEYLLRFASTKLALFGGRLVLTHNELLFPYHKWFTRVLREAPKKPGDIENLLDNLLKSPSKETSSAFYTTIKSFTDWPAPTMPWSTQFVIDSELTWQSGEVSVDDL
jgi:predicted nucleotidyltransferase